MCCGFEVAIKVPLRESRDALVELWGQPEKWVSPYRYLFYRNPSHTVVHVRMGSNPANLHRGHDVLPGEWLQAAKYAIGLYLDVSRRGWPAELKQLSSPCPGVVLAKDGSEPDMKLACMVALRQEQEGSHR